MKTKRTYGLVLLIFSAATFVACADLKIRELSISPTCPTTKTEITFRAKVQNVGQKTAGPNTLVFKVGGETVPKSYDIPSLAPEETFTVERRLVLDVAQNYQNTIVVDANNNVKESRENNNLAKQFYTVAPNPDTTGLDDFEYNEGLATILRGILIDDAGAQTLNIASGYYHIREFRVLNQPGEKVKALSIEKNYGEAVTGQSTLPKRSEPWVFSIVERDELSADHAAYKAKDYLGHTFQYEIEFDAAAGCWKVLSAKLDCAKVALSTQKYTTAALNTCGWSSEPPWKTP